MSGENRREQNRTNREIRNLARGGKKYGQVRHKVFQLLRTPNSKLSRLTPFLSDNFFKLNASWQNLKFSPPDRKIITYLRNQKSEIVAENYLSLVLDYITANATRVSTILRSCESFEGLLFESKFENLRGVLEEISAVDEQSLLFLRMYAASHALEPQQIIERVKKSDTSEFLKRALLYPLVYYFSNLPRNLDLHLQYVLPGIEEYEADQCVVRFLLNDETAPNHSLAFKCYLGLLLHPVDARGLILTHLERAFVTQRVLSPYEIAALAEIHAATPDLRSDYLTRLIIGPKETIANSENPIALSKYLNLDEETSNLLQAATSLTTINSDRPQQVISGLIWGMRVPKYPAVRDYDEITGLFYRYWFTEFGRFIGAYLVSLFLLPRGEQQREFIHLLRLRGFIGASSPFVMTGPSGLEATERFQERPDAAVAVITAELDNIDSSDRLWLKTVQWHLALLQRQVRVSDWLKFIRKNIRIEPDYLTGISWLWLETVIGQFRIKPFLKNADAIYLFLLRLIELRKNESNKLRSVVFSFSNGKSFEDFIQWLLGEYKEDAAAFLRYFLTADMVLYLRFTDNYVQALAFRIRAFEIFIEKYDFGRMLSAEEWKQETQAFTTELMLLNVGRNQFEINWEALRRDISSKQEDLFKAYVAFRNSAEIKSSVFASRKPFTHQFSTGVSMEYQTVFSEIPGVNLLCNVIDGFIEHPSQGIEAILSVRIRHNPFRRQFASALDRLKRQGDSPLTTYETTQCLPAFEVAVYACVKSWLDEFMHQKRPEKSDGLFNFVPSAEEMKSLQAALGNDFPETVDFVLKWLRQRLNQGLAAARFSLTLGLKPKLELALSDASKQLPQSVPQYNIARVEGLLRTTLLQLCDELQEWFQTSDYVQNAPVTGDDMRFCVEGYYENEVAEGKIRIHSGSLRAMAIPSEHVRPIFNMCCTLVDNALKYSETDRLSVRVREYSEGSFEGILISTNCHQGEPYVDKFIGHPSTGDTPIFREGKSGLYKVAAIAAYISRAGPGNLHRTISGVSA